MMSKNLNLIRNRGILFANICPSFLSFCLVWKDTNGGGGGGGDNFLFPGDWCCNVFTIEAL